MKPPGSADGWSLRQKTVPDVPMDTATSPSARPKPKAAAMLSPVPAAAEYVALGAAKQAAWALAGSAQPPQWPAAAAQKFTASAAPAVRARYDALRDVTTTW